MSKVIVITGASDGIGAAAARRLHAHGHRVVVVGRSPAKTAAVADELGVQRHVADFASLSQVRALAEALRESCPRIDVLANNAGGIFQAAGKTEDGFEQTFQINHLAPFLLTTSLLDTLIASKASVIQTASTASMMAPRLDLDDLDLDRRYSSLRAYGAAKLENILFTQELHRRYHDQGLSAAAFHPGVVATRFGAHTDSRLISFIAGNPLIRQRMLVSPEQGASQLLWLAEGQPGRDWQSGVYYEKFRRARWTNPQTRRPELARGLWERSELDLAGG